MSIAVGSTVMAARTEHSGDELRLDDIEAFRRPLTGYCYRMLGSAFEADDAVQETMVRAWKAAGSFEGRSSVKSWVYRIATNVCLDQLRGRQRRALAMDLGPAGNAEVFHGDTRPEHAWVTPIPDGAIDLGDDPAEQVAAKETIRLAFVTALQHLPPRQRACLILCEVLRWQATEVAALLDTTVASVNSALQRARATLAARVGDRDEVDVVGSPLTADQAELLARYVDAFERYDIESLVSLLREDAVMSMPPYDFWLQGPEQMAAWFLGHGIGCQGSRLLARAANGCAAFGAYRVDPEGGHAPFALQVIEISGDRIIGHHNFLDTRLFEVFGLPAHLDG
jgi:RNA polymerase sigma-70 factor, ECF subfamily